MLRRDRVRPPFKVPSGFNDVEGLGDCRGLREADTRGKGPRKERQDVCHSLFKKCMNMASSSKWQPSSSPHLPSLPNSNSNIKVQKESKTQNVTIT